MVVGTTYAYNLIIASPPVSFPASVVVQKALYRFVCTCERSMQVRVVGMAFLFPGRERANGSCDSFTCLFIKLRITSPPVSFPTKVVVQKALYRFFGACE